MSDPGTVRLSIALQVAELYGPVHNATTRSSASTNKTTSDDPIEPSSGGDFDWTVRIQSAAGALNGSYAVLLFVGPIPDDTSDLRDSPSFVGSHSVWTSPAMPGNDLVESFVHLNDALTQRPELDSTNPEIVEPSLTQNIGWRVVKVC